MVELTMDSFKTKLKTHKGKLIKGLNKLAQDAIMCKDNIPMLVLPNADIDKAFSPQDLKPGSEETNKARMVDTDPLEEEEEDEEETKKSLLSSATMYLRLVQKSLNEEKMDIKKDEDEDEPEKTEDASEKSVDVNKALRAITVTNLTRRQRMGAAYQLGRAQGQKHRKPAAEPAQISHESLNIGTARVRPQHEPPVVPVRRVETPPAIFQPGAEMESCVVHGYVHKSDSPCPMCKAAGIGEAGPFWRR